MLHDVIVRKATQGDAQILALRRLTELLPYLLSAALPVIVLAALWLGEYFKAGWRLALSIPFILWITFVSTLLLCVIGQAFGIVSVHSKHHEQWVAVYEKTVIAEIALNQHGTYSHIENLIVHPKFRRQGVGSLVVCKLSEYAIRPLYVQAKTELIELYIRLGFTRLLEEDLPEELRKLFRIIRKSHPEQTIKDLVLY
ncbi:MAG: GNAT family N-acetyltransferase [Cyanobacteria bacterium P01_E01_bin.6]